MSKQSKLSFGGSKTQPSIKDMFSGKKKVEEKPQTIAPSLNITEHKVQATVQGNSPTKKDDTLQNASPSKKKAQATASQTSTTSKGKKRTLAEVSETPDSSSKPSEEAPRDSKRSKRLKRNTDVIEEAEESKSAKPAKQSPVKASTTDQKPTKRFSPQKKQVEVSKEPYRAAESLRSPSSADFDPIKDSAHHIGQPMPFWFVSRALTEIEECSGKNSQTVIKEIIANVFRSAIALNAQELPDLFYFFIVKLAPEYVGLETGVGHELVLKSAAKACGKTPKQIRELFQKEGDLGVVVSIGKKSQNTIGSFFGGAAKKKQPLSFSHVFQSFRKIAKMSGNSSVAEKEMTIVKLLQDGDNNEAKYIVRWLQKNLKTGAAEKTVISALARAVCYTPPDLVNTSKQVLNMKKKLGEAEFNEMCAKTEFGIKEAACEFPNYGAIVERLLEAGPDCEALRETCHMRVGIPLKPMLAKPTKGVNVILKRFENISFTCEYKYDGFRGQVHFWQSEKAGEKPNVMIYSRNLENMTQAYPDVVEFLQDFVKPSIKDFILDAELVAFDVKADKILPFQLLTQRSRKNVKAEDLQTIVCLHAFDLLYFNGKSQLKNNFIDRRSLLHKEFDENKGHFHFAKHQDAESFEEIEAFLADSIKDCCEGLMVKTLDTNATYEPAKRSFNWLKLKKDYLDTSMGDSLDLVVVGADYGVGKRTGFFGSFLLACYNEDRECLQTVCKVGTGFSDEALERIYNNLKELVVDKAPSNLKFKDKNVDVWIAPQYVWEIKAADLSLSPIYQAACGEIEQDKGIALRFPRYIRDREDKKVDQATNNEQIVEFYKAQSAVQIDFNANDDFDF